MKSVIAHVVLEEESVQKIKKSNRIAIIAGAAAIIAGVSSLVILNKRKK